MCQEAAGLARLQTGWTGPGLLSTFGSRWEWGLEQQAFICFLDFNGLRGRRRRLCLKDEKRSKAAPYVLLAGISVAPDADLILVDIKGALGRGIRICRTLAAESFSI